MPALEEDHISTNLDYLFEKKEQIVEKYRKLYRCEECIYSEKREDLLPDYIHCTKYPYMNSHKDNTCKSSRKN